MRKILYEIWHKYYSLSVYQEDNGKIWADVGLGNMTDAGWFWDGNEKNFLTFLYRLNNSSVKEEAIKDLSKIPLDIIQKFCIIALKNKDFYALSGDNKMWDEGSDWNTYLEWELESFDGTPEKKEKIYDKISDGNYYEYETFLKDLDIDPKFLQTMKSSIRETPSISSLMEFMEILSEHLLGQVRNYISELVFRFSIKT